VAETLNRFPARAGDFYFLPARTVHAIGAGCLLCEVQQTCDTTFRVDDWGRTGPDGKPRPLHVRESLETIDFSRSGFGPQAPAWRLDPCGGETRLLVDCQFFRVEERRLAAGAVLRVPGGNTCAVLICLAGSPVLTTPEGAVALAAIETALVPAVAAEWILSAGENPTRILLAAPNFY
jgi:mannose-6-phosphate isomerase